MTLAIALAVAGSFATAKRSTSKPDYPSQAPNPATQDSPRYYILTANWTWARDGVAILHSADGIGGLAESIPNQNGSRQRRECHMSLHRLLSA